MVRIRRVELLRILGTLSLMLLVLAGCGGNSGDGAGSCVSHLTLQVATPDQLPRRSVLLAASPGQPRQVEASLTRLVMSVTGEGITAPIIADCPIPGPSTDHCRSVTETADEILVRIELTVPKGNKRRIRATAFRGNQVVLVSTEDSNGNCILDAREDTNNNGVLDDEITVDLIREVESVDITLRRVTSPAEPSSLENRTFIFKDGAAFELEGAETTLIVGTFVENTAPFRLTSQSFMASGHVTITANVTTASCDFAVESSTFPGTQGPSGEAMIPIEPCGIAVVDGRLVAFNTAMVKPVKCFTSDSPSGVVADLAVTETGTPDAVHFGEPVTYAIKVTNHGPSPATGVTLTATLTLTPPLDVIFALERPIPGCAVGTLAPGASITATISVMVNCHTDCVSTTLTSTLMVTGAEPDPNATNDNSATVTTTVTAGPR